MFPPFEISKKKFQLRNLNAALVGRLSTQFWNRGNFVTRDHNGSLGRKQLFFRPFSTLDPLLEIFTQSSIGRQMAIHTQ
jgi:hypothetical protein